MFCNKCGSKVGEGNTFCSNCGNSINQPVVNQTSKPVVNQPVKKKSNKGLIIALIVVLIGFGVSLGFLIKNLVSSDSEGSSSTNILSNTTWYASDDSEMVFEEDRLYWYKVDYDHDDNYYAGSYKFYRGKEAVEFIIGDLSSYGVTKSELEGVFDRSSTYSENDFVVIDITYDEFILDGKNEKMAKPHSPLYGFILKGDTYLDVANMNTGTYYKLTKK